MSDLNKKLADSIQLEAMKKANQTPKLEDFSQEQLIFAHILFKAARKEAIENYTILRTMFEEENDRTRYWENQADMATLWMVQTQNAINKVQRHEITASN